MLVAVAALLAGTLGQPASRGDATAGYLRTVQLRGAEGPTFSKRMWFSGPYTREDLLKNGEVVSSTRSGPECWIAYPRAERVWRFEASVKPYPLQAKAAFDSYYSKKPRIERSMLLGRPVWKYAWHEPARQSGDVGSTAQDIEAWVADDKTLPIPLKMRWSPGGAEDEVVEMRLGSSAVPPRTFDLPTSVKEALPFRLPHKRLEIVFEESFQYGDQPPTRSVTTLKGDASKCVLAFIGYGAGSVPEFTAKPRTMSYEEAAGELWRTLQTPSWVFVKRDGTSSVAGMTGEHYIADYPSIRGEWVVVDHALLGTFSLRHSEVDGPERRSTVVTRVFVAQ